MSCPCDEFVFPVRLPISAAVSRLPRALSTFAD